MFEGRGTRAFGAGAALVAAGLLVGACAPGQQRLEASPDVVRSQLADIYAVRVGDCVNPTVETQRGITSMPVVPCDQPHQGEVFAARELPDGTYPGESVVLAEAERFCTQEFAAFIGVDYHRSALDMSPIYPTEDGWDDVADRTIQCIVHSQEPTVGSLEGAGR